MIDHGDIRDDEFGREVELIPALSGRKAKARRKRGSPERDVQVSVIAYLRAVLPAGTVVAAVVNESAAKASDQHERARYYASKLRAGLLPGFPDVYLALHGGRCAHIELKSAIGRLSPDQKKVHAQLEALGHCIGVARSIDDARALLKTWGIATREAAWAP